MIWLSNWIFFKKAGKINFPALTEADNRQFDSTDVQIEILGPSAYLAMKGPGGKDHHNRKITTNSISAVIRVVYKGKPRVLLTGDMDVIALDEVLRGGKSLQARIMVFPHHGGNAGTNMVAFSTRLYDEVKPTEVLFSIGRGQYKTPIPEVVAIARKKIANVRIACTQLSDHCAATEPTVDHTHISATFAVGRDNHYCCAGSITIQLETGSTAFPIYSQHQDFITVSAPTALCRI